VSEATRAVHTVAVVGTGTMGRGIARLFAQHGCTVLLHDARAGAADEAIAEMRRGWAGAVAKGRMTQPDADAALARVAVAATLAGFASADLVIEAIVEALDAKRALFTALEGVVRDDCVLATNTSSLSVTAIAAACARPARVVGLHFFNPVPAMRLVEVIPGVRTGDAVVEAMTALVARTGHVPVRVRDTPGFLVNHAGRGYGTEALRLLQESVASPATIDGILTGQAGFRLGPFALLDLVGLDVSVPVMERVYRQFWDEPRFRPSPLLQQRLDAGLLGVKSGEGFHRHEHGKTVGTPTPVPVVTEYPPVWVSDAEPALAARVRALLAALGATIASGPRPTAHAIAVVTPLGDDATTCAVREGLDASRTVAVDALFDMTRHRTLMTTPVTTTAVRDAMHALLARDGAGVGTIADSPGLVCQRTVATIVNIACDIAQQGIAAPADIDRAVVLGLGYPHGPLAWGDALGPATVVRILERLQALTGDPRYRVSPWLRRRAALGVSLLT
jgi:3-hydroxybutyryl-CoA dehydrogenase